MTATAKAYRTPYVSQMLQEPDRTWDDCCASVTIMLGNDWTLGEWSIREDGRQRDVHVLRNLIRKRIGVTDGGLTLHDANDMLHELDPDLPDLPRYNGQATRPDQSSAGAVLRLDRAEFKALLRSGHSAALCGLSGTVGHVIHLTDGTEEGALVKDPLTRKGEAWPGEQWSWARIWAFTEAERNGVRAYGTPETIACAIVKVGAETEAERMFTIGEKAAAKIKQRLDAQKAQLALAIEERDQARRDLTACQEALPPDCAQQEAEVVRLTRIVDAVRRAVA